LMRNRPRWLLRGFIVAAATALFAPTQRSHLGCQPGQWEVDLPLLAWWEEQLPQLPCEEIQVHREEGLSVPEALTIEALGACSKDELLVFHRPRRGYLALSRVRRGETPRNEIEALVVDLPLANWWSVSCDIRGPYVLPLPPQNVRAWNLPALRPSDDPRRPSVSRAWLGDARSGPLIVVADSMRGAGDPIVGVARIVDAAGSPIARFQIPSHLGILPYARYSIAPAPEHAEAVVVAAMWTERPEAPPHPDNRALGLALVPCGSEARISPVFLPATPGVLPPFGAISLRASHPLVVDGGRAIAHQAVTRTETETELLELGALHVCDLDGRSVLADLWARYHCEGPNRHEYCWTRDAAGEVSERWNRDWLTTPDWDRELIPFGGQEGEYFMYMKAGEIWSAELPRR
jgi:hypothetical protein